MQTKRLAETDQPVSFLYIMKSNGFIEDEGLRRSMK